MNIAIIVDSLYSGGAEKSAALLSRVLAGAGHQIYLLVDHYNGKKSYRHAGLVVRTCTGGTGNTQWDMHLRAAYLSELKKMLAIDCSISFMEEYNFPNVLSRQHDKVIVSERTYLSGRKSEWPEKIKFYHRQIPKLYNRADAVVALTERQQEDLVTTFGVERRKLHIIPNAIDDTTASQEDAKKSLPVHRFVTIGRLIDVKAQWHAIRAMSEVVRQVSDAHLYVLGDGENHATLQNLAQTLGISEHIHLEGFQRNVCRYLQGATALVHTAKAEGFVNAVLDGLANGAPIIASDCLTSPREILAPGTEANAFDFVEYAEYGVLVPLPDLDKSNASLVLTPSEKALAEVMIRLVKDTKLHEHYREMSCRRASRYSLAQVGKDWLNLLESL